MSLYGARYWTKSSSGSKRDQMPGSVRKFRWTANVYDQAFKVIHLKPLSLIDQITNIWVKIKRKGQLRGKPEENDTLESVIRVPTDRHHWSVRHRIFGPLHDHHSVPSFIATEESAVHSLIGPTWVLMAMDRMHIITIISTGFMVEPVRTNSYRIPWRYHLYMIQFAMYNHMAV